MWWRTEGSSPLARGLRKRSKGNGNDESDHPRSRGVYLASFTSPRQVGGSSPLARGLLLVGFLGWLRSGIIPARAGFTAGDRQPEGSGEDHPRSRGVYADHGLISDPNTGSSPLARGLREDDLAQTDARRIIPARAGFTAASPTSSLPARDHPRSRGVYARFKHLFTVERGSSPLARGLHNERLQRAGGRGIIPARAGFTPTRRSSSRRMRDHPRSRGVYPYGFRPAALSRGSSPLARGLPSPCPRS